MKKIGQAAFTRESFLDDDDDDNQGSKIFNKKSKISSKKLYSSFRLNEDDDHDYDSDKSLDTSVILED